MSNLSRRSLVASAAALPALAVPAIATPNHSLDDPDPAISAVEKWRTLYAAADDVSSRLCAGVEAAGRPPSTLITWRDYCFCADDIESGLEWHLKQPNADRKDIKAEYPTIKAEAKEMLRQEQQWYERHGLDDLRAEKERLFEAEREALAELTEICPTTLQGAIALLNVIANDEEEILDDPDWYMAIAGNVAESLKAASVRS